MDGLCELCGRWVNQQWCIFRWFSVVLTQGPNLAQLQVGAQVQVNSLRCNKIKRNEPYQWWCSIKKLFRCPNFGPRGPWLRSRANTHLHPWQFGTGAFLLRRIRRLFPQLPEGWEQNEDESSNPLKKGMKWGGKKTKNLPGGVWNSRNSREKKVSSTTMFTMSESHKVVNYLMQTKWNISQCQNRLFTFMYKLLQRSTCWAPQRESQRVGSTCATSQLRLCDVSSWSPARLSVSNTFFNV